MSAILLEDVTVTRKGRALKQAPCSIEPKSLKILLNQRYQFWTSRSLSFLLISCTPDLRTEITNMPRRRTHQNRKNSGVENHDASKMDTSTTALLTWSELPEWMKDNEYIISGYRRSVPTGFWSQFPSLPWTGNNDIGVAVFGPFIRVWWSHSPSLRDFSWCTSS